MPYRAVGPTSEFMSSKKPDKEELIIPETAEAIDFVKGLVARGEAAKVKPDGSLPPGATQESIAWGTESWSLNRNTSSSRHFRGGAGWEEDQSSMLVVGVAQRTSLLPSIGDNKVRPCP
jgi:hypothetical protein